MRKYVAATNRRNYWIKSQVSARRYDVSNKDCRNHIVHGDMKHDRAESNKGVSPTLR